MKALPLKKHEENHPFDFAGAIILFFALVCIIFPVSSIDRFGLKNPLTSGLFAAGIILMALFVFIELKKKHPMFEFSLFKNRIFFMGNISLLLNFIAQFTIALIIPFYLIQFRSFPASLAGLILIANPAVAMIVTPLSGYLTDRFDARYLSSAGMALITAGLFIAGFLNEKSSFLNIIIFLALTGLGIGMFQTPNNYAIMSSVPHNRSGTASSMLATMRNLGMVFGAALSGSLFSTRQLYLAKTLKLDGFSGTELNNMVFTGAMKFTFIIGALLACVAVITSILAGSHKKGIKINKPS
jgi:MFS family permease